jgi:cardiolipin synthase
MSSHVALREFFRRFQRALPQPFVPGNRVTVLVDGRAFFDGVLAAIASAQRNILVETYILRADKTGWRVAAALAERAQAGVEVAVSYDAYGSIGLDRTLIEYLNKAGVKTLEFRPISVWRGIWPWRKRNHRKSVIVDTRIGIVGGQNLCDDYASIEDGGKGWRDTAVQIEGPSVAQLEAMFRRMWHENEGDQLITASQSPPTFSEGHNVRFLGNFARRDRSFIRRAYILAILGAEKHIRICNAYFVPDRVITRALIRAAKRGVNVEIIIGAATDVTAVLHMSRGMYSRFLVNGIKVYEWSDRILHAKTAVIDNEWSTIGSSNLDNLSSFRNLEVNATILGPRVANTLVDQFELDRARSRAIEPESWANRPWVQRIIEWIFSHFRGLFSGH